MKKATNNIIVFLADIRSAQNAGAIMRTADASGVHELVFGGYTPSPVDRFGRVRKEFVKASLGAEKHVQWREVPDILKELKRYKKEHATIVAVEQHGRARDYKTLHLGKGTTVLMFGNEVSGIPKKFLSLADTVIEIPMRGEKESLNVSVSAGIVLYRLLGI